MSDEEIKEMHIDLGKIKNAFLVIFIIAFIILLFRECKSSREDKISENLQEVLKDSLRIYVNKDGSSRGRIFVLESIKSSLFTKMESKDSTIIKLQKLVKANNSNISKQGSVSVINTEGKIDITVPTKSIDTTKINGVTYPTYLSEFNLKGWVWGTIKSNKDSTNISLLYKDEFNVIIGREKTGFLGLGKSKAYADVISKSPYTAIKQVRVYQTKLVPSKNFHIGPGIFYGVGSGFQPQVFVGAGIMYTPFNF